MSLSSAKLRPRQRILEFPIQRNQRRIGPLKKIKALHRHAAQEARKLAPVAQETAQSIQIVRSGRQWRLYKAMRTYFVLSAIRLLGIRTLKPEACTQVSLNRALRLAAESCLGWAKGTDHALSAVKKAVRLFLSTQRPTRHKRMQARSML